MNMGAGREEAGATDRQSQKRIATWLCTIAAIAVVGSFFATARQSFAPLESRSHLLGQAPVDISTDTQFTIMLPAADILTAGTAQIAAENTDGKLSAPLAFIAT